jgi:hypothetical protein
MIGISHVPVQDPHVEAEVIDNEVVLYHPRLASALYLNPTAALIWGLCDGKRSIREIQGIIENSYPDAVSTELLNDILASLASLQKSGVISVR